MIFSSCKNHRAALTLLEVLVVLATLAVIGATLLPTGGHRQKRGAVFFCLQNLRQIGASMNLYANDNDNHLPVQSIMQSTTSDYPPLNDATYFDRLLPYLNYSAKSLTCPADVERIYKSDLKSFKLTNRQISYFLNLDAVATANSVLCGDRDLTNNQPCAKGALLKIDSQGVVRWSNSLHSQFLYGQDGIGNILFGDGHAETLSQKYVQEAIQRNPTNTTRLLLPW